MYDPGATSGSGGEEDSKESGMVLAWYHVHCVPTYFVPMDVVLT